MVSRQPQGTKHIVALDDSITCRCAPDVTRIPNFFGLSPAGLALCEAALAEAPPLSDAEIDVISTLMGITPVNREPAHPASGPVS